jgi:FlaA1/EpsC-like NDP-sugar epimerase
MFKSLKIKIDKLFRFLVKLTEKVPCGHGIFLLISYSAILTFSYYASFLLRFDFNPTGYYGIFAITFGPVVAFEVILLFLFGQFSILLRYFRIPDLYKIAFAMIIVTFVLVLEWYIKVFLNTGFPVIPRGIVLGNFIISLFLLYSFRVLVRVIHERSSGAMLRNRYAKSVAVIGAGDVGSQVVADMLTYHYMRMRPVVFLDDDKSKWKRNLHGIPIWGSPEELPMVKEQFGIEAILIAMPSASVKRVRDIVDIAGNLHLSVQTVPSMAEILSGRVRTTRIRQVQIEDLLGRKPVDLEFGNIRGMISGRVVMVTGAGGSIGNELVDQIATYKPSLIVALDQSEFGMFSLMEHLKEEESTCEVVPVVADICDIPSMRGIFAKYKPAIIFHAAAYKHVPMMERQPGVAVVNNSFGTAHLAELASEMGLERFVLISTDKAINPTSAMGASKRLAEIYIQALNYKPGNKTRFMAVRFGNVLNSSGSVIPTFRRQIEMGGPVTVTHPEVTRYFMTIPEAVGLVLQCGTQGEGGEIFVLNMGTPVKILDMARQMIIMSGLKPDVDIDIKFTGLRPGEKLYEELRHNDEEHVQTRHERIYKFRCEPKSYDEVVKDFDEIKRELAASKSSNDVRQIIKEFVPEYKLYVD